MKRSKHLFLLIVIMSIRLISFSVSAADFASTDETEVVSGWIVEDVENEGIDFSVYENDGIVTDENASETGTTESAEDGGNQESGLEEGSDNESDNGSADNTYLSKIQETQVNWVFDGTAWYAYDEQGEKLIGWIKESGTYYYLKEEGQITTGWNRIDDRDYYFNENGKLFYGWVMLDGKWYYIDLDEGRVYGFQSIENSIYYFDPLSGDMQTDWVEIDHVFWFFRNSGVKETGWILNDEDQTYCYVDDEKGRLTGFQEIDSAVYYFNSDGIMQTGLVEIDGFYYFFNDYGRIEYGYKYIDGNWYRLSQKGGVIDSSIDKKYSAVYDVSMENIGASGADQLDDTDAIKKALVMAYENASDGYPALVMIPEGTYYISSALAVFSNTSLILDDKAVIIRTDLTQPMLINGHYNEDGIFCQGENCTHGGYSKTSHVEISGGVWDANSDTDTSASFTDLFGLSHCEDFLIQNTKITNCTSLHMISMDGASDMRILNVSFTNCYYYTGNDGEYYAGHSDHINSLSAQDKLEIAWLKEAVHMDFTDESGSSSYPLDGTPSQNIVVKGCYFENVMSGIGNHHTFDQTDMKELGIVIEENTFIRLQGNAINACEMPDFTIRNNKGSSVECFLYANDSSGSISGNGFTDVGSVLNLITNSSMTLDSNQFTICEGDHLERSAVVVSDYSSCRITDCTLQNVLYGGVRVYENASVDLSDMIISGSTGNPAVAFRGGNGNVKGCKILNSEEAAFSVSDRAESITIDGCEVYECNVAFEISGVSEKIEIKNNRISNTKNNAIQLVNALAEIHDNILVSLSEKYSGIRIMDSKAGGNIYSNSITGGYQGISLSNSSNILIKENTISESLEGAISVNNCSNITITKNQALNSESGIDIGIWESTGCICKENCVTESISDNIQTDSESNEILDNSASDPLNGWKVRGKDTYYYVNGEAQVSWQEIDGAYYHFRSSGKMDTSWIYLDNDTYYLDESGKRVSGWLEEDNYWYYFDENGVMVKSTWYEINSGVYHFRAGGKMDTLWYQENGIWYFLQESGKRYTGWLQRDGEWYYFNNKGEMMSNAWLTIGGSRYHFRESGKMDTGWLSVDNKWYYLYPSGKMHMGWLKSEGYWYYMSEEEGALSNGWHEINGESYYFDGGGKMYIGWLLADDNWYYLQPSGKMTKSWCKINDEWYYFGSDGIMTVSRWVGSYYVKENGKMAVSEWIEESDCYVDSNGIRIIPGWRKNSVGWWYVEPKGTYPVNCWKQIDGEWYYFEANGYIKMGWYFDGTNWYYLSSGGRMLHDQWVGNYYLKTSGKMAVNEWVQDHKYFVGEDGKWIPDAA